MTLFRFLDHNTFFTMFLVSIHAVELQGPDSQHTEMIVLRDLENLFGITRQIFLTYCTPIELALRVRFRNFNRVQGLLL